MNRVIKFIGLIGVAVVGWLQAGYALADESCSVDISSSFVEIDNPVTLPAHSSIISSFDGQMMQQIRFASRRSAACRNGYGLFVIENLEGYTLISSSSSEHNYRSSNGVLIKISGPLTPFNPSIGTTYYTYIKIMDAPPGLIHGDTLPRISFYAVDSTGMVNENSIKMMTHRLIGTTEITRPSCQVENKVVNLGRHSPDTFTAVGTTTEWVDSSVRFNCSAPVYANYQSVQASAVLNTNKPGGVEYSQATSENAQPSLWLLPSTEFIDKTKGIFKIDSSPGSAEGIGIQISRQEGEDSFTRINTMNSGIYLNGLLGDTLTLNEGQTSFNFPLYARYIQTESTVRPGTANGKIVVTHNYL